MDEFALMLNHMEIIRANRKTISMRLDQDCRMIVRAPFFMRQQDIMAFVTEHRDWALEQVQKTRAQQAAMQRYDPVKMRAAAKVYLPQRCAYYGQMMNLMPAYVHITAAQKRFGSCNSHGGICFSLYLMRFPSEAVDYVVVHELAHLKYMNHGADFYRLIASVLPDWKERSALLRD